MFVKKMGLLILACIAIIAYTNMTPSSQPSGVVVVSDFGAIANDGIDDTIAIQNAINYIKTNSVITGGTVHIPSGSFIVSKPIEIPTGTILQGASSQGTRIEARHSGEVFKIVNSKYVQIRDLEIDGVGQSTGIAMHSSSQIGIKNVQLQSLNIGVYIYDSYFIDFNLVRIVNAKSWSFNMGYASNSITMNNVSVFSMIKGHRAVEWSSSSALSIYGSTFEGIAPIFAYGCQGFHMAGSYFENDERSTDIWLRLGHPSLDNGKMQGVTIVGNLFNHGAEYGIQVNGAEGVKIEGNHFATTKAAVMDYRYDKSAKKNVALGFNSYASQLMPISVVGDKNINGAVLLQQ